MVEPFADGGQLEEGGTGVVDVGEDLEDDLVGEEVEVVLAAALNPSSFHPDAAFGSHVDKSGTQ